MFIVRMITPVGEFALAFDDRYHAKEAFENKETVFRYATDRSKLLTIPLAVQGNSVVIYEE